MKKINVVSCFDGLGGLRIVLKRLGIKVDSYYASEIDESAMLISNHNFPDIIQLGDIREIRGEHLPKIDLVAAGSPCQNFSMMGKKIGMVMKKIEVTSLKQYLKLKSNGYIFNEKSQSYLFWEFIRLIKELNPKYFFLENVCMSNKWMYIISRELKTIPYRVNSSLVSGQNRDRLYWTNIPGVSIPEDKKILLSDVIPDAVSGYGIRGYDMGIRKSNGNVKWIQRGTERTDKKSNCILTVKGNTSKIITKNGEIRNLTITEAELLQTLPKNYTNITNITETKKWKAIGNGWTIDVVTHLLKPLKNITI